MGETVVINIEANTTGLQSTIDTLTKLGVVEKKIAEEFKLANEKSVKSLDDSTKKVLTNFEKVDKAVKDIKVSNETAKNLDLSTPVVKTANAAKTLRQEYKEAVTEAARLSKQFGENSDEALRAQKNAAQLKDTIGDLNTRINTLNPDAKFRAISNLGFSLQGIFYTATGTLQAFGIESEKLDQVARNFQGFLGALTGLNQLTDAKDNIKNLAAALGLTQSSFAIAANAAAETTSSFAEGVIGATNYNEAVSALNATYLGQKNTLEVISKVKKGEVTLQLAVNAANAEGAAQNIVNTETKTAELAAQEALNAAKAQGTVASTTSAAANAAETESTIASTGAKVTETAVTDQATKAQTRFNLAVLANPYVLITAAIVALAGAIIYFASETDEAAEAQKKLDAALRDTTLNAKASVEEESVRIDLLVKKYKEKETSDKERLNIVKKLNEIAPETIKWFNKEGEAIGDLDANTKLLIKTKQDLALVDAFIQEIARLNTENIKIQNKTIDESTTGWERFTEAVSAYFTGDVIDYKALALKNNQKELDANNKLIEEYKNKLQELGSALTNVGEISDTETIDPFEKALESSKNYYDKLRIAAAKKAKDDADYEKASTFINSIELEAKLKIYKDFKKNTNDLELQLEEEKLKIRQEFFKYELEDLEKAQKERENLARKNALSEQEFNEGATARRFIALQEQLELYRKYGKDTVQIQTEIDQILLSQRKSPAEKDKQDYENALSLIDQYYNAIELNILQNAKTRKEADKDIAKNEIEKLQEQIKAGEAFGQNVDELKKKLAELKFADIIEEKKKDIESQIADLLKTASLDLIGGAITRNFQNQIDAINEIKEQQLENIDEEEKALQDSYDRREIGKRELELKQKKYAEDRLNAERKAELEIAKIKQKQAITDKAAKIFEIAINTAKNAIEQPGPLGALVPYWIALGAAQAAVVAATPIPKYKKGTLNVPGFGTEDSVYALLQPGEAVIPTETNKKYATAIKAIYENRISANDINTFVKHRLEGSGKAVAQTTAMSTKLETSDLYALGRMMKKNDSVYVKNLKDLAFMFERNNRR